MHASAFYVAFDTFPRAKGSSSHIASMVRGLARNFGSVRLLCLGLPDMPAYQREGDIEIFRFRERRRRLLSRATAFTHFVSGHVRQLSGKLRLAVFRDPWGGYPLLEADPRCPALFEVNALPSWELAYSRPEIADNVALVAKLRDIERRCLRGAAGILCVSSVTRGALAAEGYRALASDVIPNVAHDVFFRAAEQPCPVPELETGRWCGYVGGLQSWQGVETLIDAFAMVAPELSDARLLILHGDSKVSLRWMERRIARHQLQGRVLLKSSLTPDEVAGALARMRFTAVPLADTPRNTVQGCCPVKMVESMAAGIPVIASDLAVCREWVRPEREGLLVAPGDTRQWALALRRLFTDDVLLRRLSEGARRRAEEHFSWPVGHGRLDNLFQRIAAGHAARGA